MTRGHIVMALALPVIGGGVCYTLTRRTRKRVAAITALVLLGIGGLVVYALTATEISTWVFGYGEGSPEYARWWGTAFRKVSDPESAKALYPEVAVKRFDNGEWIFGISLDSHASIRGGTIVLKDSTGRVRAFFGHVCGPAPGFLEAALIDARSLADVYDPRSVLMSWVDREYKLP